MKNLFNWSSHYGISASLFLIISIIYILIGTIGLIITYIKGSGQVMGQFFLSKKADELIFGQSTGELTKNFPQFANYITMLMLVFCSFMIMSGIMQYGIARYGFTNGASWAYWVSVISNFMMLFVYWFLVIIPVMKKINVSYFELWHPYAFIPTILLIPAIIFGWLGLK